MTNDEILQDAKEAGLTGLSLIDVGYLERFAAIIEKRTIERCALVCEQRRDSYEAKGFPREFTAARACAAAIRKLGEQE